MPVVSAIILTAAFGESLYAVVDTVAPRAAYIAHLLGLREA